MKLAEAINSRRSIRSYTGEIISDAELKEILNAAYAAPVGRGKYETLALTVITNKELLGKIDANCAAVFGDPKIHPLYGAPMMILVSTEFTGTPKDNVPYSNAACVVENMALKAEKLGVGACHIWGAVASVGGISSIGALLSEKVWEVSYLLYLIGCIYMKYINKSVKKWKNN